MNHPALMREALALAARGRGYVEPNPRVGALALHNGRVVGRGYHGRYGGPHAEVVALADAAAAGAAPDTLVVTLEPCSSPLGTDGKKTPPCTAAILAAGIRQVVVGAPDPDPRHHQRAAAALAAAGVQVVDGVLRAECEALNRPFVDWLTMDVPWFIAKWAMTLDGRIATHTGDSRWVSGPASRQRVHAVRAAVDAVVVGYRTALVDDPELTVRHVDGPDPIRVVVDPSADLPLDRKLLRTAGTTPTWVLVDAAAPRARTAALQDAGATVLPVPGAGAHRLDLAAAARLLRDRGLRRVLVEGGGGLTAELFAAGLVPQAMVFVAPKVVGGTAATGPVGGAGVAAMVDAWSFRETCHETVGDDLLLHAFA